MLSEEWIGRMVIYEPKHGPAEYGRIKSLNTEMKLAFIVYGLAAYRDNWKDYTGRATDFDDIPDIRLAIALEKDDPPKVIEGT